MNSVAVYERKAIDIGVLGDLTNILDRQLLRAQGSKAEPKGHDRKRCRAQKRVAAREEAYGTMLPCFLRWHVDLPLHPKFAATDVSL